MIHEESISNKLTVLFVFEKMEVPIREEQLLTICSIDNSWIPYFDCQMVIGQLIKGGFILKMDNSSDPMLTLGADGHHCLLHFHDDIPYSRREEITAFCRDSRMKYKKKQEFFCNYSKNADGSYTIEMKIFDLVKPIFQLKLIGSYKQAINIYNNWNNKGSDVYQTIYELLMDE